MERLQMCKICRINIANYVCKLCGASVCTNCYSNGVCIDCKRKRIVK